MSLAMKVIEIFDSIDGEGIFTGCLSTFIRLSGCNMRCSYCDTRYAFSGGTDIQVSDIVSKAEQIGNKHITITGGEPLIHNDVKSLVDALCDSGFIVNIETNGSVDVREFQRENTVITMDYKTISSGENSKMRKERLEQLRKCDVLKIVCNESDFDDIKRMLKSTEISASIFISPIFGEIEASNLVEFAKELRNRNISRNDMRVQVQLHKVIWDPQKRGV